ncbi:MAG: hypothetical protein IMZ55_07185 [Acidobacteria bacterium]|nr:hypothetical protein [Acidobacteriota bacterium]
MSGVTGRRLAFPLAIALLFLAAHLPFLAPTLEDIDSINFALGVRDFNPGLHQPHPPGSPVFIALAKISTAALDAGWPSGAVGAPVAVPGSDQPVGGPAPAENAARGLAFWGAVCGALAAFPLLRLFERLDGNGRRHAPAALLLALACPLMWFTAVRPLSDVTGLAAAIAGQALLAGAFMRQRTALGHEPTTLAAMPEDAAARISSDRLLIAGAFVSAFAIGLRSQVMWLTLPLALVVLAGRARHGDARIVIRVAGAAAAGAALWAIPLVIASGGLQAYLAALANQGSEDFSGIDMLWRNPTPKRLAVGLLQTFVLPWASVPLAGVVTGLALVGGLAMLRQAASGLVFLLAAFGPYAIFHLLFHETVTTRYALPLMPAIAYLAVRGAGVVARRAGVIVAAGLIGASLVIVVPPVVHYGRERSPVMRLVDDLRQHGQSERHTAVLARHRRVWSETRRAVLWGLGGATPWAQALPSPAKHEWFEIVRYWQGGGTAPVWFLAEPSRTDLALVDPWSYRLMSAYRWPFPKEPFVGGVRPGDIDWYEIRPPGWFVADGWALTPESAGVAAADGKGPGRAPIEAWLRRRPGAAVLMIGGRNLGGPGAPVVQFTVALDGRVIERVAVKPAPGFFLRFVTLPDGGLAGAGQYARLSVSASRAGAGTGPVQAAVEQFDLQDAGQVIYGFDTGWHELEYNPKTGRVWRWSSEAATVRVYGGGRDVRLRVAGESPLEDFDQAPHVTVRAGQVTLGRYEPAAAFSFDLGIPAQVLEQADGIVTLETDGTFVPDERSGNGDRRRLGLRVYSLAVRPARTITSR